MNIKNAPISLRDGDHLAVKVRERETERQRGREGERERGELSWALKLFKQCTCNTTLLTPYKYMYILPQVLIQSCLL